MKRGNSSSLGRWRNPLLTIACLVQVGCGELEVLLGLCGSPGTECTGAGVTQCGCGDYAIICNGKTFEILAYCATCTQTHDSKGNSDTSLRQCTDSSGSNYYVAKTGYLCNNVGILACSADASQVLRCSSDPVLSSSWTLNSTCGSGTKCGSASSGGSVACK